VKAHDVVATTPDRRKELTDEIAGRLIQHHAVWEMIEVITDTLANGGYGSEDNDSAVFHGLSIVASRFGPECGEMNDLLEELGQMDKRAAR
jgi:hypothetical protein